MKLIHLLPVLAEMTPDDFGFDYAQRVPTLSMAAMVISMLLAILVPVLIFFYLKRRFRLNPQPVIYGLLAYMLGAFIIPTVFSIGLQALDSVTGIFTAAPILYAVVVALIVALLELASIYLGMKFMRKRVELTLGTALLFAIMFNAFPLFQQTISSQIDYFSISSTINQGSLYDIVAEMIADGTSDKETIQGLLDSVSFLINSDFFYYILLALDGILMIPIHMGICAILAGSMNKKIPKEASRLVLAITGVYALSVFLRYSGIISSPAFAELICLMIGAASLYLAYRLLQAFQPDDLKRLLGKPDKNLKPAAKEEPKKKMPKIVMPKD